jgi:hypothetical protein
MSRLECKRLDLCWPQWIHFGSQEHYRISWNIIESHGRFWNIAESSDCGQMISNDDITQCI